MTPRHRRLKKTKKEEFPLRPVRGAQLADFGQKIRQLRTAKSLTGRQLCERSGDLDPRTLTAVEKGRIKNPSITTLLSLARGLGVTISDLFREAESDASGNLYQGTQKGTFKLEFPEAKLKIVSFTPFVPSFFCGKIIFGARSSMNGNILRHPHPFFMAPLIGRFDAEVAGKKFTLKEGENLYFNGNFEYLITNPLHRESVLLVVTAPSFARA